MPPASQTVTNVVRADNFPPPMARGLYLISPPAVDDNTLMRQCAAALDGGARILQYRDKPAPTKHRALLLQKLCADYRAIFIINDDAQLAMEINADGVHLGTQDGDINQTRRAVGDNMLIGATCHNRMALIEHAVAAGADYCALGAIFHSPQKPTASPCRLSDIVAAKKTCPLPLIGIGGITAKNAAAVFAAGADAIAVSSGVFAANNITAAVRRLLAAHRS